MIENNSHSPIKGKEIVVETAEAKASVAQTGKLIGSGVKKERIKLLSSDERFNIAIKTIKGDLPFFCLIQKLLGYVVEIKDAKGNRLLLNVNSVAKRLHLSSEEVIQLASKVQWEVFIEKAEQVSRIFTEHQESIEETVPRLKELWGKNNNKDTLLLLSKAQSVYFHHSFEKITIAEKIYFLSGLGEKIETLPQVKYLGGGAYGSVVKLKNIQTQETYAMKVASDRTSARNQIANEYNLLQTINPNGKAIGIVEPPHKVIHFLDGKVGYLTPLYDRNYKEEIELRTSTNRENKLNEDLFGCYQLLHGLATLHEKKVVHGDIKLENILCRGEGFDKEVKLADFGGARKMGSFSLSPSSFTSQYNLKKDFEKRFPRYFTGSLRDLKMKSDVFALGTSFFKVFNGTSTFPYEIDDRGGRFQNMKNQNFFPRYNESCPHEIRLLINKMVDPDDQKRVSSEQALIELTNYLEKTHPEVHNEIQNRFKAVTQ